MKLEPLDADYPRALCHLNQPPALTLSGPLDTGRRVVAIVGSRSAPKEACAFTHALAYHLAKAGVVVVSGGAVGIDSTAHLGAVAAGGTTWCVACTGRGQMFPESNRALFEHLEQSSSSRMIWPFPDGTPKDKHTPRFRNGVLVGLAECVIVVQAGIKSGSRNAITWARHLGRRLFLVPSTPWDPLYDGTMIEGARGGAEALWSTEHLFHELRLHAPDMSDPGAGWSGIMPLPAPNPTPSVTAADLFGQPPVRGRSQRLVGG